jgi:hypothetical protein
VVKSFLIIPKADLPYTFSKTDFLPCSNLDSYLLRKTRDLVKISLPRFSPNYRRLKMAYSWTGLITA